MDEIVTNERTWFVTLTLTPEHQARVTMLAARKDRRFDGLTEGEQFALRAEILGPELTKWLKRLRATAQRRADAQGQPRPKIRYLWVFEAHKNGLPHVHALVHQVKGAGMVTYRDIVDTWPMGFAHAKLVDDPLKGARYVAKYITKAAMARIRASQRYGNYGNGSPQFLTPATPDGAQTPPARAGVRARALSCACAPARTGEEQGPAKRDATTTPTRSLTEEEPSHV